MQSKETFNDLIERYDAALKEYGLSARTRLEMITRANVVTSRHEKLGKEELDGSITSAYVNEIEARHFNGEISKSFWTNVRRSVERFLFFVQTGEVKLTNPTKGSRVTLPNEYNHIAEDFLESFGFHPNTRNDARWAVHKYFAWLGEQDFTNLSGVGAEQIQKFLLDCSRSMSMGSVHDIKLYIAKLYVYLYDAGLSESSYQSLFSFPVNRATRLQPILSKGEVASLLDSIDRGTKSGKRSYAIMLLGAVLGLRACDVTNLKLSDIDWINGEIKILQTKTSETVALPLTRDVGEALQDYLFNARPEVSFNQVFIRLMPPYTPLRAAVTIGEIYRDCCVTAGFEPQKINKRFHTLRRTLGTSMVAGGTTIDTVAQVLGHTEINSAQKYISLDGEHLKICALSFDGIAPANLIGGVDI